jgi:hypothetical protein
MNVFKNLTVLLNILAITINCAAQNTDITRQTKTDSLGLPGLVVAAVADKFAISRPLNIEFAHAAPYSYRSVKGSSNFPDGKFNSFEQTKVSANISFIKRQKWLLGATLGYRGTSTQAEVLQPGIASNLVLKEDFHYLFSAVSFTYFSTLFMKRAFFSSTVLVDGSEKHFERIKGIFTGTMLLTANQKTKITVGLLLNIDASAQTPIIPTFTYEHKFNNGFIADITLPKSMYLRKFLLPNTARLSLGTELDQTSFYLYNLTSTTQKFEYRQLDIKNGLVYEHAIGKYFLLTARSGIKLTSSGRIFRKEDTFADPVYEINPDPAFYFNLGISFNPFSVFGKKP